MTTCKSALDGEIKAQSVLAKELRKWQVVLGEAINNYLNKQTLPSSRVAVPSIRTSLSRQWCAVNGGPKYLP